MFSPGNFLRKIMVTGSTVFTDTWNTLHNVISGNILHPAGSTFKFIFSAFPDTRKASFKGFPIVTISPVESTDTNFTFGFNQIMSDMSSQIDIFTTKAQDLDTLGDDVYDSINSNRDEFLNSGLMIKGIEPIGIGTDIINDNQKIHFKSFGVMVNTVK